MSDNKPIRIGVVGCGAIAQIMHLPHLRQLEGFKLSALCDISSGAVNYCGEQYGVAPASRFTTVESMLEKSSLDAVLVCDLLHSDASIAALNAGCHVIVEKPMAFSLQECDAMLEAKAKSGKKLMIAYMKRYDPAYEYAQMRVQKMKNIFHVHAHDFVGPNESFTGDIHDVRKFNDVPPQASKNAVAERMQQALGTLTDTRRSLYGNLTLLCSHDLAILRGMFGSPRRIVSAHQARGGKIFHAIFDYSDNFTGVFEFGFFRLKKFDEVLSVYSDTEVLKVKFPSPYIPYAATAVEVWEPEGPGKAERPGRDELPGDTAGQGLKESIVLPSYDEAFRRELQHFAECIRKNIEPRTTPESGREDVRLCIEMAKLAMP